MKRPTRSAAVGLAAALGLTVAVIPGVVSATGDPEQVEFVSKLTLDTKSTPQLTLEGTTLNQNLTTNLNSPNKCSLVQEVSPSLLSFTGLLGSTPMDVGFKDNSLGVNEKIASVCNRVDALSSTGKVETLAIALAPELEVVNNVPVLGAKSASLDIEVMSIQKFFFKQRAVVEAKAYDANNLLLKTITIAQGQGGCAPADGSNCRLDITMDPDKYFTKLTLTAKAGGFSLEGGSDPVVPATDPATTYPPTTFELVTQVDEVFKCEVGNFVDDTASNTKVTYVGSAKPGDCVDFGATLNVGDKFVQFLKPLNVDPTAQFEVDLNWTSAGSKDGSVTLPEAYIDFEVGAINETKMEFCPAFVTTGGDGYLGIEDIGSLTAEYDQEPDLPGTQFACISTRVADVTESEVVTTDKIFLIGDAKMSIR